MGARAGCSIARPLCAWPPQTLCLPRLHGLCAPWRSCPWTAGNAPGDHPKESRGVGAGRGGDYRWAPDLHHNRYSAFLPHRNLLQRDRWPSSPKTALSLTSLQWGQCWVAASPDRRDLAVEVTSFCPADKDQIAHHLLLACVGPGGPTEGPYAQCPQCCLAPQARRGGDGRSAAPVLGASSSH